MKYEVTYIINDYTKKGVKIDDGVFIFIGDTRIKVASTYEDWCGFLRQIQNIKDAIDNWHRDELL